MHMKQLIDRVRIHASAWLDPFLPVLVEGSFGYIESAIAERERDGGVVDPLARQLAGEVLVCLDREEPDIFAAYFALEIAAQLEPDIFGPTYRLFRRFMTQAVVGASRGLGGDHDEAAANASAAVDT